MKELYDSVSYRCSKIITQEYSTSFSMGIRLLDKSIRHAIFNIYGFVRLADEIVDTFHDFDKEKLLNKFEQDYYEAHKENISLNPVLHAFQLTVKQFNIDDELIQAFLKSMRADLTQKEFNDEEIKEYIYGSADVVGLMCLRVFVNGDDETYNKLKPYAMRLGSAFQKVNFLRDINNDVNNLHRVYFPVLLDNSFTNEIKKQIIADINEDYRVAREGIKMLPKTSQRGVFAAYMYYKKLTKKIERTQASKVLTKRIRISNPKKLYLLGRCYLTGKLKLV
ncbi:MAG: phytoene/squalene synthase family protein [Bacteroidales bacterium]|nr:phytoene/squalene synthase family protein [Bacteroidales bacterium]